MHKIEFKTGPNGFETTLVCPEDCDEKEVHEDQFSDYGCELIPAVDENTVLATVNVEMKWDGNNDEAELWVLPVLPEA